ncbi:aquaporin-2-like [Agrilus planipennis]|uniref:Aquaporin-2-like n=1 Tax=Agrilus planipennis TaxID=224129 RepID=A0A7F5QXK5_AGRPL|nr:aquaporin-2-like [Agrilus planipennis]
MWDSRNRMHLDAIAVKLAFVVICEVLAFGHITGCHMNPARSFAPALINLNFEYVWYFIFGQLMGGICGATIYRLLFALPYDDEMEPWIQ